jgi:hypothetical protein
MALGPGHWGDVGAGVLVSGWWTAFPVGLVHSGFILIRIIQLRKAANKSRASAPKPGSKQTIATISDSEDTKSNV